MSQSMPGTKPIFIKSPAIFQKDNAVVVYALVFPRVDSAQLLILEQTKSTGIRQIATSKVFGFIQMQITAQ